MYTNETLAQYIKTLAAKTPVPGGGSAAALCGALGTALLEMACNFTAGKKGHEADEADIHSCLASLKALREEFTALIDEDSKAYSRIHDAFKAKDEKAIESALKAGYEVALNACKLSRNAMLIASSLPEK
ncbi:MAG: cyclodeaminase/cyclohydrolase family protein, partial [Candidatus Omnitrophica bacterium]|nr:cyclodeaminase/cyclohydrolase family protein [Candidatus Omnitrophota bacterium]